MTTVSRPSDGAQDRPFITGTRGSALALVQTELILASLRLRHPGREFVAQVRKVVTEGDRSQAANVPLQQIAGQGIFVKELEDALLAGEIDLAVHSLKDMTTELPSGLIIGAVTAREDVRDVLVSRGGLGLAALPSGARVGTGSARRAVQVRAFRPDLEIVPIRGNVDTRIRKVETGEIDAAVLAAAGIIRLGAQARIAEYLSAELCIPAVGQGALAIEVRADDAEVLSLVGAINDEPTWAAVLAERAFLRALGGGCANPIGAYGRIEGGRLVLDGFVSSMDGQRFFRGRLEGNSADPEALGDALARQLLDQGAADVLSV